MNFLVLQHAPWEGPGQFLLAAARKLKIRLQVTRVWQEAIPDPLNFDALLILGGGANVDQEKQFPYLREEKEVIRRVVAADLPCLGICLGHQLLAEALGARVGPNFCSSVGFVEGYLTSHGRQHPAFAGMKSPLPLFKWHGYTVLEPLPGHLQVLMTSDHCQVEALSVAGRPHLLGLQSDNHAADPRDVGLWLEQDRQWLASLRDQRVDPSWVLAQSRRYRAAIAADFQRLLGNYLRMLV
ncbi:type 1 glutamine amidotransferase [Desulfurivibrio alkaliphilus]|uniref:Glutamine amidotransferase class-I n=1 Tax=Desulfurivibrio alkaliphilus (strain DSM 19089 / UNIQEM U267 / AHT2) TaxID=589865 RepID=D6Z5W0_DESAT|nr:type 1 glutamine amidotransferase [Desulfurivibrio alkaliphilus]ADH84842.1 glutamine amidotransferase class-I [Desulfurivibrio alkaliphilus AHT 2]